MKKGPSLVELLIILAIVGLIAGLSFSIFTKEKIKADISNQVEKTVVKK